MVFPRSPHRGGRLRHSIRAARAPQLGKRIPPVLGGHDCRILGGQMKELITIAEKIAAQLVARKQTIAVAESSTGGLLSAALLSVPGASAYFLGGAVVYTRERGRLLMDIGDAEMKGSPSSSEPYAQLLANRMRERFATTWGL